MGEIHAVHSGGAPLLRIVRGGGSRAVDPEARAQQLEEALERRLTESVERIRARLAGGSPAEYDRPNPPAPGERLDIRA